MPKRFSSCVTAVFAGLFATSFMFGTHRAALAADDCLAGPNRAPGPGGHWYFHSDKASNRKCWYLVEAGTRAPAAEAPETQPVEPTPQPSFGSFFSLMGFPGTTAGPQPDTTNSVARPMPYARPDDVRNGETSPGPQGRTARRPDSQAALTPKQRRPSPAAPTPAEHADDRPAPPDHTERDALFQEFLRWRERKAQ